MEQLNEIAEQAWEISKKRIKNGAKMEQDNLKHAAAEVIEATIAREHYLRVCTWSEDEVLKEEARQEVSDELMDVIICILIECKENKVDIEEALKNCMKKNLKRALGIGDKL